MCSKVTEQGCVRNRNVPRSTPSTKLIWSSEFEINSREFLRAELRGYTKQIVLDLRRWFKPLDSAERPTGRGFAISAHHLSALKALIGAAVARAEAGDLPNGSGEPR
jgi:Transcriptional Coactivator p15 (PC4)